MQPTPLNLLLTRTERIATLQALNMLISAPVAIALLRLMNEAVLTALTI